MPRRRLFLSALVAGVVPLPGAHAACSVGVGTCYADFEHGKRVLTLHPNDKQPAGVGQQLSHELCAQFCENLGQNATLAGVETGTSCFCGRELAPWAQKAAGCSPPGPGAGHPAVPCPGNKSESCGAWMRMLVVPFQCNGSPPNSHKACKSLRTTPVTSRPLRAANTLWPTRWKGQRSPMASPRTVAR
jgi:hypothetical protein